MTDSQQAMSAEARALRIGQSRIGEQGDGANGVGLITGGDVDLPGASEHAVAADGVVGGAGQGFVAGGGHGVPGNGQPIAATNDPALLDAAGDDQVEVEHIGVVGLGDDGGTAEFSSSGIEPVGGVGTGQAAATIGFSRKVAGQGAHVEPKAKGDNDGYPAQGPHNLEPTAIEEELVIPLWLKALTTLFALAIVGAIAFAYFEPVQVLPRIRLAPGYALVDQSGETYTSESARGVVTVYTFAPTDCDSCDQINNTMAELQDGVGANSRLDNVSVRLVTIALDEASAADLETAASRSGADGTTWRWIGGEADGIRLVAGDGFRHYYQTADNGDIDFDARFVVTDGAGIVRGEYRYQTLADDADKLMAHLEILADEIRYSSGAASVAYEAAHLFLCYP